MKKILIAVLLMIPSPAFALVTSAAANGTLTVTSDIVVAGAGDTITVQCTGDNVQVNGLDPSTGAIGGSAITALVVNGGAGDDTIDTSSASCLGSATRTVNGGGGNDTIQGSNKADVVDGGEGNDTINGKNGKDTLTGGIGNDTISGGNGKDTINGGEGDDTLSGGNGNDRIDAGAGTDTITDNKGSNTCSNAEAGNCGVKGKKPGNGGNKGNGKAK